MDLRIEHDFAGKEWMVPNGLGGYASGMIDGEAHRRHDGLLVAALGSPFGRTVMLDKVVETLGDGAPIFSGLTLFALDNGLPVWRFEVQGRVIERRLVMPYRQNTTMIRYRLLSGAPLSLTIRPWIHVRGNDGPLDQPLLEPMVVHDLGNGRAEVTMGHPAAGGRVPMTAHIDGPGARLVLDGGQRTEAFYPIEADRDYGAKGPLWSPGFWSAELGDTDVVLTVTTEEWAAAGAMTAEQAFAAENERRDRLVARADPLLRNDWARQLVLAADAFLFIPQGRPGLAARAHALGDETCSVIAGYPWFNDWGRDTMISLEGLTLVTGRFDEARRILRTFAQYVRDGLIPDNVPDGKTEGVYHAADATLWFFHAVDRYMTYTNDTETLAVVLPKLLEVIDCHRKGTLFGIKVDPADGLLRQGVPGHMLTWMDSDTPRRGKAVEINALWYNALRVTAEWLTQTGDAAGAAQAAAEADRARESFNKRFWNPAAQALFDVVDGDEGDDPAIRPNQIFAVSLPHPILDQPHWAAVLSVVHEQLLTPLGLRSLNQGAASYKTQYAGNLWSRDQAYHRGTVWAWLIGPFIDAWRKVHPADTASPQKFLDGFRDHLGQYCVGTIAEVFDGDAPHAPRGCTAQAWSVAEVLRARVRAGSA